ncbi:MAG: hypothetical protein ACLQDQ_10480 [Myxococcaceae bacterium]
MTLRSICIAALAICACSHTSQLAGAELDRVQRPAFVGRLGEGAGPKAQGLATASVSEAELLAAMNAAIGKFEVSERIRSQLAVALHAEKPWSNAVPASQVASALETFLVERVPPVPPDYSRLKPTGADAVLEIVVEDFGVRPDGSAAQSYLRGYARLFLLDDGTELWRADFQRSGGSQGLAPFAPATFQSNATPYGDQMRALLDASALSLAQQLSPTGLAGRPTQPASTGPAVPVDADKDQSGKTRAPAPDLTQPADTPAPNDRTKPKSQPAPDLTPPSEQPVTPK